MLGLCILGNKYVCGVNLLLYIRCFLASVLSDRDFANPLTGLLVRFCNFKVGKGKKASVYKKWEICYLSALRFREKYTKND